MQACIIAVGDELIRGKTVDSNSAHLARRLAALGIDTIAHWTVGDDTAAIDDEHPFADLLDRCPGSAA